MAKRKYKDIDKTNEIVEEAYKVLRTNIQFSSFDRKIKTLAITSCNPGEGKTTTAINLSISIAKSGMKVLLVDADLRKPMMSTYFGDSPAVGLSNIIAGTCFFESIVTGTCIENLYYIPSGPRPPNPAEMIGSPQFRDFISSAVEDFDMVIFDTPPLGSVIDSAIIAANTDGTILVIKSNASNHKNVRLAKEQLIKVNACILGVVLNKVSRSEYKNYCNYSYYGYEKKKKKVNQK